MANAGRRESRVAERSTRRVAANSYVGRVSSCEVERPPPEPQAERPRDGRSGPQGRDKLRRKTKAAEQREQRDSRRRPQEEAALRDPQETDQKRSTSRAVRAWRV